MDSDIAIQALNPELFKLLVRVKAIYMMCGGDSGTTVTKKQMKAFDYKKSILVNRLVQLDNLAKDKSKIAAVMSPDSREMIRMKNQMRFELQAVEEDLKDLIKQSVEEAKGKKVPSAEAHARTAVLETIKKEFYNVHEEVTGVQHAGDERGNPGGVGMSVIDKESLMKGAFAGAGIKMDREELTGEHMQQMELIRNEVGEQDAILEEMGKGLDELKEIAERINDELQLQDKMLTDLEKKTDKAQGKLDKVNEKAGEALKMLNDKSTNCCIYLICLAILGALAVIVWKFVAVKQSGR